jgi:cysteinyl-tRNA synthetase
VTWDAVRQANRAADAGEKRGHLDLVLGFDRVLGLSLEEAGEGEGVLPAEVARLIEERESAREARDWQRADSLREAIRQIGYEIEDTPEGTRWRRST